LNCNGGLKPHLELSKFFSSLKHEIFHSFNKFNTMNRGIMLCFSMIIDFFSVVIAMSIVVCAWTRIIKSLNFNFFCSFFVVLEPSCLLKLELPILMGGF
jgi:hypothetical protein